MNNKFREAQDVLKHPGGMASAGFNRKVHGDTYNECFRYQNERTDPDLHGGWNLAERMISEGELFYVHNFHYIDCPEGYAFQYGGSFVCNTCNKDHLGKEWWKIRIFKDGNAWCCIGVDFQNLQESDNYAFGDTRAEAIKNYGQIYEDHDLSEIEDNRTTG